VALSEQLVRYAEDLARVYAETERTLDELLFAWVQLLETKIPELKGHSARVAYWAERLNQVLDRPLPARELRRAAWLHDIGFLAQPEEETRRWFRAAAQARNVRSAGEAHLFAHAELGARLLAPVEAFRSFLPWIRHHHERWDGSGPPEGRAGEAIPLGARVLAVAEVMEFYTRLAQPLSLAGVRKRLGELAGSHLDPRLVEVFLDLPLEELVENYRWLEAYAGSGG